MYEFDYNADKNIKLKRERGITFDEIIGLIEGGFIIGNLDHPNQIKYPSQRIYMIDIDGYVWLVPYIKSDNKIFLKTAFPTRKETRKYFGERNEKI